MVFPENRRQGVFFLTNDTNLVSYSTRVSENRGFVFTKKRKLMKIYYGGFFTLMTCCSLVFGGDDFFTFTDALLKDHVRFGVVEQISVNLVAYNQWSRDPRYKKCIDILQQTDVSSLQGDEVKAFWINAYNVLAVKMVLDHYPVNSIKDVGSFFKPVWDRPVIRLRGRPYSLGEIEHKILRPMGDPRIHFAIVCASLSCPDIRPEAFDPARLDEQLDDQAQRFLSNRSKGLQIKGDTIYISAIFKWFEDDFTDKQGVIAFIEKYAPENMKTGQDRKIKYLPYDWSLNDLKRQE